ncbi:MAG: mechanosensitive ion channel family protein [Chloroflexi bacterium]|nr:mechanosensitive ion channel family protein [Chloroflexota bacterium]
MFTLPDNIRGDVLWETLIAVGIVTLFVAIAYAVLWVFRKVLARVKSAAISSLDDYLFKALRSSIVLLIMVQGGYIALTTVTFLDEYQEGINKTWVVAVTALVFWILRQVVMGLTNWYGKEIAPKTGTNWDERALPIFNRVAGMVIITIGVLAVLQELGLSISPLLAGLGIGGLAVALALQPTLSNFLSGTYILSDGSIRPGDFIEVHGGPLGTVQGVGWRATRILTPQNNMVLIPNSRLSDSTVINYSLPEPPMSVFVTCGVSYDSDLEKVEVVALEVAKGIVEGSPMAVKDYPPSVIFREFGDSNITFLVIMRGINRGATFTLQHELVKLLQKRFAQEGIEINYPVRKLVFADAREARGGAGVLGVEDEQREDGGKDNDNSPSRG